MGYWGTGLYQNDVSDDVKEAYLRALKDGNDNLTATKKIMEQCSDYIADEEDSICFWLALADTQWNMGRLLPDVKDHALLCLERCFNDTEEEFPISKRTLTKLKEKLMQPQPPEKRIPKERRYICPWKIGDVFAFQIGTETFREHPLFHHWIVIQKVRAIPWYPHHIIPVITVRYTPDENRPLLHEVSTYPFIPIAKRFEKKDEHGRPIGDFRFDYELGLIMTSKRNMPDTFFYLGKLPVQMPKGAYQKEKCQESGCFHSKWIDIEERLLGRYTDFVETGHDSVM